LPIWNALMRALLGTVLTVWLTLLAGQPALADKRVALVIGNSSYQKVARLSNPANDAAAVAAMLKSAGFDSVDSRLNLNANEMRKTLREFGNRARDADVAVIYYAGHGIELDGTNYLIPVDATLETDTDVLDETFPLERVLFTVEPARQLRLVILDACRDNPFAKTMKRTIGSRAIGRGLAKVEPSSPNTMIAFAAKAGSTASDGDSKNSPFATALVNHLPKPGLDLRKAFGFVRDDVLKATGNTQEPFVYGSLGGNDVTLVPAAPAVVAAPVDQDATMRRDYEFADRIGTKPVWDAFIEKYPSGFFTALAKAQRDKLLAELARLEATLEGKDGVRRTSPARYRGRKGGRTSKSRGTGQGSRKGPRRRRACKESRRSQGCGG
jgi:Caspase domain